MMTRHPFFTASAVALSIAAIALASTNCAGQMINTSVPYQTNGSGFYESHGVNFGFSLPGGGGSGSRLVGLNGLGGFTPNLNFTQGSAQSAIPTFGGYNPNAGATFGFGRRNPNGGGFSLGLSMAKGSNRQSITTAPSLTTQNGFGGSMSSGSIRPFVTGVIPIVGHGGSPIVQNYRDVGSLDNGVTRAINSGQLNLNGPSPQETPVATGPIRRSEMSTAQGGALSVKEIKAQRNRKIEAEQRLVESIIAEAVELESQGKFSDARTKYREGLRATDNKELEDRIKAMIKASRLKG